MTMTLKSKIAKIMRIWAEKLDPIIPYNTNYTPYLKPETYNIQKVTSEHSIPRYLYEQNPNRMHQLVCEDIAAGIAKELAARNLISIIIMPGLESVDYIGGVDIIDFHKDTL